MSLLAVAWTARRLVVWLNVLAILGVIVYALFSLRKTQHDKPSQNLTPFLADDELEGPRLERVLGWALFFAAIIAVALPVYWLREPTRQADTERVFDDRAVERGEILYSNKSMETYDSAKSLACADCHGTDGGGGSAPTVQLVDGEPAKVSWLAPALDTVLYRFSPQEVSDILVYGRQGTPMQPWGVLGGGPKNDQSISDLVAYINDIQITPEEAQANAQDQLDAYLAQPAAQAEELATALEAARTALDDAEKELADLRAAGDATEVALYDAEKAVDDAEKELELAEGRAERAEEYAARRVDISDGQALFELNCARCHTENWSYWVTSGPALALPEDVIGPPGGGGTLGFNLRGGQSNRRFPNTEDTVEAVVAEAGGADLQIWQEDNPALEDSRDRDPAWTRADCEASPSGTFDPRYGCLVVHGYTAGQAMYFDQGKAPDGFEAGQLYQVYVPEGDNGQPDPYRFQLQPLSLFTIESGRSSQDPADSLDFPTAGPVTLREEVGQTGFVTNGSDNQKPYGYKGIGSGRMPGQCNVALESDRTVELKHYGCELTPAMVNAIVDYERNWLDATGTDLAAAGSTDAAATDEEVQP